MTRRNTKQKLVGWGILAAIGVVIVAVFAITRAMTPAPPTAAGSSTAEAASLSFNPEPSGPGASVAAPPAMSSSSVASGSSPSEAIESAASAQSAETSASVEAIPSSASSSALAVVEPDKMDQQSRKAMLLTLIDQGIFTAVQALDSPPKVGVTPLFKGLDPSLQQQFVAVAYAYINKGASGTQPLQLIDATSGKEAGSFSTADGLRLF